mmetsp:Transcript_87747/g.248609  ORF Transcript_87747/g.248609 Transcript_87747/m.248609 type:complete len:362 (+) Transcript_87747:64-1149(+)|eukprot:CAMPEP_0168409864 /NCGR_PEP_ID=MMETSP0228-20121227/27400_1 /TAXON_ID=133427 /ORGANISM="Protoceratium reticulatum, Strain CCCM 535 (=CCMP 1889)" /LENGTH=361 /DNA_ID=CAMNT_0008423583 /DNA_START=80 /DNA_END=1165 /DNA_ORIENTATION=-
MRSAAVASAWLWCLATCGCALIMQPAANSEWTVDQVKDAAKQVYVAAKDTLGKVKKHLEHEAKMKAAGITTHGTTHKAAKTEQYHKRANQCANKHTPMMCNDQPATGNYTAHLVVSTYREDLAWLNEIWAFDGNVTVMAHDRAQKRSHNSKDETADSLNVAEDSEAEVKALNPMRKDPVVFQEIPNAGDEGGAYLAWIIKKYYRLPDVTFFVQGHRCSDHAKFDMGLALPNIRKCWNPAEGYLDLNTYGKRVKNTVCKDTKDLFAHGVTGFHIEKLMQLWKLYFQEEVGPPTVRMCYDAFAQFAVTRDRIKKYTLGFYKELFYATVHGNTTMEFFWRLMFAPEVSLLNTTSMGKYVEPKEI